MKPAFPAALPPLFTEPAECQDCYKCIRQCPVKAIRVQDGHAAIVAEHCIGCGTCVEVCPAGSKHIRNDTERARLLIQRKERVFVSLAPSYRTEFGNVGRGALIEALLALGFSGVSETALGAQEVTAATAAFLKTAPAGPWFSSACPVAVDLVKKYYHDWDGRVSDLLSPALAHAQLLRHWYGQDCGVVFIGPCIAKKRESDAFPHLIDVTLTFPELRQWLNACGKLPEGNTPLSSAAQFVPHPAQEGMLYPVDGGMLAGLREHSGFTDVEAMAFSGIGAIRRVLDNLHEVVTDNPLFIELLACEGGCVNGPCSAQQGGTIAKRLSIISQVPLAQRGPQNRTCTLDVRGLRPGEAVLVPHYSEEALRQALRKVGKTTPQEELNCGGCGYDSCRHFALALLSATAEPAMCVSYMRALAHKKANALLRTMPSGVVIVDEHLKIVECNRRFAEIMGGELLQLYSAKPGLEGALVERLLPFASSFRTILDHPEELIDCDIRLKDKILHLTAFPIDAGQLVGGIIHDITEPAIQKERIVEKAQNVIEKNLQTVQKIAYLLGENAADSEVILNSIIQSFTITTTPES